MVLRGRGAAGDVGESEEDELVLDEQQITCDRVLHLVLMCRDKLAILDAIVFEGERRYLRRHGHVVELVEVIPVGKWRRVAS